MSRDVRKLSIHSQSDPPAEKDRLKAIISDLERQKRAVLRALADDFGDSPITTDALADRDTDRMAYYRTALQENDAIACQLRNRVAQLNGSRWETQLVTLGPFTTPEALDSAFDAWCQGQNPRRWRVESTTITAGNDGLYCAVQCSVKVSQRR